MRFRDRLLVMSVPGVITLISAMPVLWKPGREDMGFLFAILAGFHQCWHWGRVRPEDYRERNFPFRNILIPIVISVVILCAVWGWMYYVGFPPETSLRVAEQMRLVAFVLVAPWAFTYIVQEILVPKFRHGRSATR